MLFKEYHIQMILEGRKTQTRRIWARRKARPGSIHKAKLKMLSPECFAYIKILDVRQEMLVDISEEDAQKEGYQSRYDFLRAFRHIHPNAEVLLEVWVVDFELSTEEAYNRHNNAGSVHPIILAKCDHCERKFDGYYQATVDQKLLDHYETSHPKIHATELRKKLSTISAMERLKS